MRVNSFDLYQEVLSEKEKIQITGQLNLSKTKNIELDSILEKDWDTFRNSISYFNNFISEKVVLNRYNHNEENIIFHKHVPVKTVIDNGIISQNKNVFIYFPCTIGKEIKIVPNFSIELLDTSESIYKKIVFPCVQKTFVNGDEIVKNCQYRLREKIYLYSYFHELGHTVGTFKVLPQKENNLKIKKRLHAIWGEISSDFLVLDYIGEIPDLFILILFIKIFWYSRIHFKEDQQHANINNDNDSWEGVFFWNIAYKTGLVEVLEEKLFFDIKKLEIFRKEIKKILNTFDTNFLNLGQKDQNKIVSIIMDEYVEKSEHGNYVISKNLNKVFNECIDLPEFC